MTQEPRQPSFVAFGFDYTSNSNWSDLPRLREGLHRLANALSATMQQHLSELSATSTPTEVMEALDELLLRRLSPDDSILIYLCGHGARLGNDHFIVGPSAERGSLTARNGLSAADLAQVVAQGQPRQVSLIFDACYSGAAAARLAADVDAIISRQRGDRIALSVMSSARSLEEASDGAFIDTLLDILANPDPVIWKRNDRRIPPGQVALALTAKLEGMVECREHGYVLPLFPNLAYRVPLSAESARHTREHFLNATSGVETGTAGGHFVGRTETLGAIATWLGTEPSGVFVLTGPPGSGKSAILGRVVMLADEQGREDLARRDPDFDPSAPSTPALGSVNVAIHAREKTLEAVVGEVASGLGIEAPVTSRDEILALVSVRLEPTCILVDALDEAFGSDVLPIAEFLRDLADLPTVKVLVGTRPDRARMPVPSSRPRFGPILHVLEPERVWNLQDDPKSAFTDIVAYVRARLSESRDAPSYAGRYDTVLAIANEVARRVDGVFLYARLMVQALLRQAPLTLETGWESRIPGSEGGDLLASVVAEDLQRIPSSVRDRVRHMLMALAWAEGEGLPRYRVWSAVAAAITDVALSDADAAVTIHNAAWYLVQSAESEQPVYRLHHEELVHYFRGLTKSEPDRKIQERIARELWKFAGRGGMEWVTANAYVRRHLAAHAAQGQVLSELVLDVGFLGAADPTRLVPALSQLAMGSADAARSNARTYLRLGADRIGAAIGRRLANLGLECATEEREAQLNLDEMRDLVPWTVQFARGRRSPFQASSRVDASEIVGLAVTLAGSPVIASSGLDHRVRLWNGSTGDLIAELKGHRDIVRGVAIGPVKGAQRVVSGSADGTVRLWDPESKECLQTMDGRGPISCVAMDVMNDCSTIAAGGNDGSICMWDAATGDIAVEFRAHSDGVASLVFGMIDGVPVLVSGSLDRTVNIWNARTGERLLSLSGPTGSALGVAVGQFDGISIVGSANSDESVWIWDANSGAVRHRLECHSGAATCLCFGIVDDTPIIASGSADLSIRVWDCRTGECLHTLRGHRGGVRAIAFARFGERPQLISGSADRAIRVWDALSGQSIAPTNAVTNVSGGIWAWIPPGVEPADKDAHAEAIRSVAFGVIDDRRVIISGSLDEHIHVRDAQTGKLLTRWRGHVGGVLAVSFMVLDEKLAVVSGGADAVIRVWDARDGSLVQEFPGHTQTVWGICCGVVDGRSIVVSGSRDRSVRVWDAHGGESIPPLTGTRERVWGVALGMIGDRPTIAAASTDRRIWLWDARSGKCLRQLQGHARGSRYVVFGELDGRTIVIASGADGTIRVWDAASGDDVALLPGHTDGVWGVTYGTYRDRALVVSTSDDLTVRIWDLKAKRSLIIPQTSPAYSVACSDGWLAVGTHRHVYSLRFNDSMLGQMNEYQIGQANAR
jgi:WD40 repeat protein